MGLASLSPSRAGDFKTCPQLFKFRAIDHLCEPPTSYQARGTTAHRALQMLFGLPAEERTPEALFDLFRKAWAELRQTQYPGLFPQVEDERAWGLESLGLLANYFVVEDPSRFDPLSCELDLIEDVDGMTIRGILDRMEETGDGRLVISDYKTGKAPAEQYSEAAFFALKIYASLVKRRTGRTPDTVRLIYLNGPTIREARVTDAQLDAVDKLLRALWSAIERAIELDDSPPRPGPLCDWCYFRPQCPGHNGHSPSVDPAASTQAD